MDERLTDSLLRVAAGVLTVAGVVAVLIGYLGVRDESDVALQIPYVMSGGVGGLALIGLGALALLQYQLRLQARRFAQLTEDLDAWKEAALAEVRAFLEEAEVEVEVRAPVDVARVRSRSGEVDTTADRPESVAGDRQDAPPDGGARSRRRSPLRSGE